jgi:hypothetical protein
MDEEDRRQQRDIDYILSGRGEPDAKDQEDIDAYIERLEKRRDEILESGPWRLFKGSELADLQFNLGRASYAQVIVREKSSVMRSRQADQNRLRDATGNTDRQRDWWQRPPERGLAEENGQIPPRDAENADRADPASMRPVEREAYQAGLLERKTPKDWWDDGGPQQGEPDGSPERDRR